MSDLGFKWPWHRDGISKGCTVLLVVMGLLQLAPLQLIRRQILPNCLISFI